jgi:deoxyribonuclease IV
MSPVPATAWKKLRQDNANTFFGPRMAAPYTASRAPARDDGSTGRAELKPSDNEPFLLGCHLSIAAGLSAAVDRAEALGNTALQIFTHSPSTWRMRTLDRDEVNAFRDRRDASAVEFLAVHSMYLVNLATPDVDLARRSVDALTEEVRRAAALGADVVVTHVGHAMGSDIASGRKRAISTLRRVVDSDAFQRAAPLRLLLENTAGSGTSVGTSFTGLAEILAALDASDRIGVCLDTCHAMAAGYDLRSEDSVDRVLQTLAEDVGLERLSMIHLNDAMHAVGSRRDRHEHIGRGTIGEAGMRALVNHPAIRSMPFILETPKRMDEKLDADPINLARVRSYHKPGNLARPSKR